MKSSPPGADPSVNYLVNVDQFILTNIFPSNLGATDLETSNERLYFRIVEEPQVGFITHLRFDFSSKSDILTRLFTDNLH